MPGPAGGHVGTMDACPPAAEDALADLAFRPGAAQVAALSPAERELAAAAAARSAAAPRRPAFWPGRRPGTDQLRDRIRAGEDPLGEGGARHVNAAQGRVHAGGLARFEPGEMGRLPVPLPPAEVSAVRVTLLPCQEPQPSTASASHR